MNARGMFVAVMLALFIIATSFALCSTPAKLVSPLSYLPTR